MKVVAASLDIPTCHALTACFFTVPRMYEPLVEERTAARGRWRRRHPGRDNARGPNFPAELAELPPFGLWLKQTVAEKVASGVEVDPDVEAISKFPAPIAMKYRSMYAYGYKYRVQSAETSLKTCDSGIAATFVRECRFGIRDQNPVFAPVEYVGSLEEILELNYGTLKQVVLIGTWVRANYRGSAATVKKDEWGLTIANFSRTLPFGRDSFAFPSQVEQVFFSNCLESPGWKVVVRTEPRGRRVVASNDEDQPGELFRHGRDSDFAGLQVPEDLLEGRLPPSRAGRVIRVADDVDDGPVDPAEVLGRDLGESSAEE